MSKRFPCSSKAQPCMPSTFKHPLFSQNPLHPLLNERTKTLLSWEWPFSSSALKEHYRILHQLLTAKCVCIMIMQMYQPSSHSKKVQFSPGWDLYFSCLSSPAEGRKRLITECSSFNSDHTTQLTNNHKKNKDQGSKQQKQTVHATQSLRQ